MYNLASDVLKRDNKYANVGGYGGNFRKSLETTFKTRFSVDNCCLNLCVLVKISQWESKNEGKSIQRN